MQETTRQNQTRHNKQIYSHDKNSDKTCVIHFVRPKVQKLNIFNSLSCRTKTLINRLTYSCSCNECTYNNLGLSIIARELDDRARIYSHSAWANSPDVAIVDVEGETHDAEQDAEASEDGHGSKQLLRQESVLFNHHRPISRRSSAWTKK